jgi:transcriptional regulator with XRE-family HTH domain
MRAVAGMQGKDLAERLGWQPSKVSRIENAIQAPAREDIDSWVKACGQEESVVDTLWALLTEPAEDDGEDTEDTAVSAGRYEETFGLMVGCLTAARRLGHEDPAVALLARALTATVNGRPAAGRVYLAALEAMLDRPDRPAGREGTTP